MLLRQLNNTTKTVVNIHNIDYIDFTNVTTAQDFYSITIGFTSAKDRLVIIYKRNDFENYKKDAEMLLSYVSN